MRSRALLIAGLMLATGCVHRSHVVTRGGTPASGVATTFNRHVVNALDAGEGDFTLASLRRKLASDPANLAVRLELVRRYRNLGFPDLALEHARLAAERFPESAEVQVELARCLRELGMRGEAAERLESFLRQHPKAPAQVAAWLGILRDELGQWVQGEAAHRAALALEPNKDYLYNNLGYNLLRQGRLQEARQMLERALELNPRSPAARNNLGLVLALQGEPALEHFQRGADPATAHNNLACVLIEQGRYTEARRELEAALAYNQNHPAVLANLKLIADLDGQAPAVAPKRGQGGRLSRLLGAAWRVFAGVEKNRDQRPQR